jgi:rubrerythrin
METQTMSRKLVTQKHWHSPVVFLVMLFATLSLASPKSAPKTVRNLEAAIQGEANAANQYQLFSHKAEQEGYEQVAKLFRAASQAESIHRENHQMALLAIGGPSVRVELKPVKVADTRSNLQVPIRGEAKEQSTMYPRYIRDAEKEDVPQAIRSFNFARDTEAEHERLFKKSLTQLGHNPSEDYYVSKITGYTVAIPSGHTFAKANTGEYFRVS